MFVVSPSFMMSLIASLCCLVVHRASTTSQTPVPLFLETLVNTSPPFVVCRVHQLLSRPDYTSHLSKPSLLVQCPLLPSTPGTWLYAFCLCLNRRDRLSGCSPNVDPIRRAVHQLVGRRVIPYAQDSETGHHEAKGRQLHHCPANHVSRVE